MRKQNDPLTQQRVQAVRQYKHALKRGDLAVVAAVLGAAEDDPVLEAMLLQVDSLAQAQEGITVPADQLLQARRFLSLLREEVPIGTNDEVLNSDKNPPMTVRGKNGTIQERKGQSMQKEHSLIQFNAGARHKAASRMRRFPRAARFMQMAAAVLIVGALIAGFQLVFSLSSGALRQTTGSGTQSSSPPGIYISRSDGVYRYNVQTRKVIWHTHVAGQASYAGEPVILGNTLYIITNSWVSALDAQTGTLRWSHDFQVRVMGPSLQNGLLYFTSTPFLGAAALYAVNPANGTITATYTPIQGQKGWNAPVVVNDILYYVANSTLYAVHLPGEKLVWQQPLSNSLFAGQIVQNGIVYVKIQDLSNHGLIEAFDAHTGSKLWQSAAQAGGLRTVTATNEMIYAASFGGELQAFNAHTHALVWQKSFNTYDIQAVSGVLYIEYGPDGGRLAALNAATGTLLWQQQNPSNGLIFDSIHNGVVYGEGSSNNGKDITIYAFNASNGTQFWTMLTGVSSRQWGGMVVA